MSTIVVFLLGIIVGFLVATAVFGVVLLVVFFKFIKTSMTIQTKNSKSPRPAKPPFVQTEML